MTKVLPYHSIKSTANHFNLSNPIKTKKRLKKAFTDSAYHFLLWYPIIPIELKHTFNGWLRKDIWVFFPQILFFLNLSTKSFKMRSLLFLMSFQLFIKLLQHNIWPFETQWSVSDHRWLKLFSFPCLEPFISRKVLSCNFQINEYIYSAKLIIV